MKEVAIVMVAIARIAASNHPSYLPGGVNVNPSPLECARLIVYQPNKHEATIIITLWL